MNLISFKTLADSVTVNCPGGSCSTGLPKVGAGSKEIHTILALFFGIAAVISVLMIVIGALNFVTSGDNPQKAAKARDTIIYAVVGLLVSLFAEAIVIFILRAA